MLRHRDRSGRVLVDFQYEVEDFIRFAHSNHGLVDLLGCMPCPYTKYKNLNRIDPFSVEQHLYTYGFMHVYLN